MADIESDDSLVEYYKACGCSSGSDSDDSMEDSSVWRAAAARDSPLRGTASRRSAPHRHRISQLLRSRGGGSDAAEAEETSPLALSRGVKSLQLSDDTIRDAKEVVVQKMSGPSRGVMGMQLASQLTMPLEVLLRQQAPMASRRRAILFDVLCAVRQSPTTSCQYSDAPAPDKKQKDAPPLPSQDTFVCRRWNLSTAVVKEAAAHQWPPGYMGVLQQLLHVANDVAALQAKVQSFQNHRAALAGYHAPTTEGEEESFVEYELDGHGRPVPASAALGSAAYRTLQRLCLFASRLFSEFQRWIVDLQDYLVHLCSEQWSMTDTKACDDGHAVPASGETAVLPAPMSILELVDGVEVNVLPLRRCLVLLQDSSCFTDLPTPRITTAGVRKDQEGSSGGGGGGLTVVEIHLQHAVLAARLLDRLIIQASALQDTSTMDLYRFYVTLLLHCAWPYVLLCTAALFGFVEDIDPPQWRLLLPRLFRSSFSHVRIGDAHRRYPTDILSLILNCIGYYGVDGDHRAAAVRGTTNTSLKKRSGRSGQRRRRYDQEQAALSALSSSRGFVLHSLASFTRQKKQLALSRSAALSSTGNPSSSPQAAAAAVGGSGPAEGPMVDWTQQSVKDIVHYILHDSSVDTADARQVLVYADQLQERRGRVIPSIERAMQLGIGADGSYRYYPTTIPLGFAAMQCEALPGEQAWRSQCAMGSGEDPLRDEESLSKSSGSGAAIWSLRVVSSSIVGDILLQSSHAAGAEDPSYNTAGSEDEGGVDVVSLKRHRSHRGSHQLWINTIIPCARWVTAALLIPIGVAVQRLQERRLQELFTVSLLTPSLLSPLLRGGAPGGSTQTTSTCSFLQAVKLITDIALCRDQERVVKGFLERLRQEPQWWTRQSSGSATYEKTGTAAPAISALFADCIRGKRLGHLVQLSVLPTTTPAQAAPPASAAAEMLSTFASLQLHFALPEEFAIILQPRDLSVYLHPQSGQMEHSYRTFFWQRRRGLYTEADESPTAGGTMGTSTADGKETAAALPSSDVWSYVFGYLCALHYTQLVLRDQKKELRERDKADFIVVKAMDTRRVSGSGADDGGDGCHERRHGSVAAVYLQRVSRGLGSAYYALHFTVEALLSFTQREAMRVVYELEHLLGGVRRVPPMVHSCIELCQQLDALLLQLFLVSFPCRQAGVANVRQRAMRSVAVETVRGAIAVILEVALDPTRLPLRHVGSRVQNAIETLVVAISAAEISSSALTARLQPLRVIFTFNHFYGPEEEKLSYRFR